MKNFFEKIYNWIKNNLFLIILLLIYIGLSYIHSIKTSYSDYTDINVGALTDSVHYTATKSGDMMAYKQGFVIKSQKELKELYPALYADLKDMNLKKADNAVKVTGNISFDRHDTVYIIKGDSIKNFKKNFDFSNKWRDLSGTVSGKNDSVTVGIDKDAVRFSYTVMQAKDGEIYIKSDNPYVRYNELTGFKIQKQKTKRWGLGIQAGYGVGSKVTPYIGIGLSYNIFVW